MIAEGNRLYTTYNFSLQLGQYFFLFPFHLKNLFQPGFVSQTIINKFAPFWEWQGGGGGVSDRPRKYAFLYVR